MAPFALRALALVALVSAVSAVDVLPLLIALPSGCGRVRIVESSDTCQSIADFAGISLADFQTFNPLLLCGMLPLTPGAPVCTGDSLAFCNNLVTATAGDTCASLPGEVVGLPQGQTCATLAAASSLPVCVSPAPNKCAKSTICGISISSALQNQLGFSPDYCDIVSSCEGNLKLGTFADKPSLVLTLASKTPSVTAVLGNDGHPELNAFADSLAAGSSQLEVTFTPSFYTDGSNSITFSGQSTVANRRKLLGGYIYRGGTRTPCCRYY